MDTGGNIKTHDVTVAHRNFGHFMQIPFGCLLTATDFGYYQQSIRLRNSSFVYFQLHLKDSIIKLWGLVESFIIRNNSSRDDGMKTLSRKSYGVFFGWSVCTGILTSAFLGWLEITSVEVAQVYVVGWLVFTNAAITLAFQSSRLALALLISGWAMALALCIPGVDVLPKSYSLVFLPLLISSMTVTDRIFVYCAYLSGFGHVRCKEKALPKDANAQHTTCWPVPANKQNLDDADAEIKILLPSSKSRLMGGFGDISPSEAAMNRFSETNSLGHYPTKGF